MNLERAWRMGLLLLLAGGAALAAPQDDYRRGLEAYQRGDVAAAMTQLRPAAAAGHAPAQRLLAYLLEEAGFQDEAVRLYGQAAAAGDAEANAALASLYVTGRGVAKDETRALAYFSKAAELGQPMAIEIVALAHISGALGTAAVDPAESATAIRRAAENGHIASVEALAQAYRTGRFGVLPDATQAANWEARAEALRRVRAAAIARERR